MKGTWQPGCEPWRLSDTVVARFHTTIRDADLLIHPEPATMAHPVGMRVLNVHGAAMLQSAMIRNAGQILGPIPLAAFLDPAPIAWAVFSRPHPLELHFAGEGDITFELAVRHMDASGLLGAAITYGYLGEASHSALICEPDAAWRMIG